MRTFYVRPQCDAGYGSGNGKELRERLERAAGGRLGAMSAEPAQLWVCGDPRGQPGFMTVSWR
jgi:hypothetical protein